jgi:hypothetical protein
MKPTEAQIQAVLRKANHDPRKLAIAYLKAQSRAKSEGSRANIHEGINDIWSVLGEAVSKKGEKP